MLLLILLARRLEFAVEASTQVGLSARSNASWARVDAAHGSERMSAAGQGSFNPKES